jgi:transcriptional regulator with XRE-family HTH domain
VPAPEKLAERTRERLARLGETIRLTRRARGISRAKLAESIGMHPSNYAHIERGHKNVTVDTLLRIADGLDVELVIALGGRKAAEHLPGRPPKR